MSIRITLSDREIWHIVKSLEAAQKGGLPDQVTKAGRQALQDIIDKIQPPITDGFELHDDGSVTSA